MRATKERRWPRDGRRAAAVNGVTVVDRDTRTPRIAVLEGDLSEGNVKQPVRENREFFGIVLDSTADCILVWGKDYNCLYANRSATEYAGRTRELMIGRSIRGILNHLPDLMRLWMRWSDLVSETGRRFRIEEVVPPYDEVIYRESVLCPMREAEGNVRAMGALYRDVPESGPAVRGAPEAH